MMKYIFSPEIQEIPQWKRCYYDSKGLKEIISVNKICNQLISIIRKQIQNSQRFNLFNKRLQNSQKSLQTYQKVQHLSRMQFQLKKIIQECHKNFYQISLIQMQTLALFTQMKVFTILQKVSRLLRYKQFVQRENQQLTVLIQNAFIEVYFVRKMVFYNKKQQSEIRRQYEISLYEQEVPPFQDNTVNNKLNRNMKILDEISYSLQLAYKIRIQQSQSARVKQLLNYGDQQFNQTSKQMNKLGFSIGIALIFMASILFFKFYHKIEIQTNKTYQSDFPIWRGSSYIILYQWILGFSFMFMERSQINYKLILNLEGLSIPKSQAFLFDAQVTTSMFLFLFLLYMIGLAEVIQWKFRYFGHIMWLFLIIYLFIPLPWGINQGKKYFLKLLGNVVLSVFPFIRSNILVIWITEQFVSFTQPMSDFAYSICKLNNMNAKCDNIPDINLVILIVIFTYRMNQNLKVIHYGGWRLIPPFYGVFRAFSSMVTAIVGYIYRKQLTTGSFVAFIIVAVITTGIAIFVDLKADWGLLDQKLLRKNLFFANYPYFYYICMFINIILRCNWILNISPAFVNSLGILPFYLIMIITYLQLFRRGLWNIFRIQNIHVQNCQAFMATVDDSHIENELKKKYSKILPEQIQDKYEKQIKQKRNQAQLQLLLQNFIFREDVKKQVQKFVTKQQQKIDNIEKELNQIRML